MENYLQNLSANIKSLRKQHNLTGEQLAGKLGITFQAVSKWENEQCSPDIALLPTLSQIFNVTIDKLFSINKETSNVILPWDDDKQTLHAAIFKGHTLLKSTEELKDFNFTYDGEALNVSSNMTIICNKVVGNVSAGCDVTCTSINNSNTISVGCNLTSTAITTNTLTVGCDLTCNNIEKSESILVGCDAHIDGNINGDLSAGNNAEITGDVSGHLSAGCNIKFK